MTSIQHIVASESGNRIAAATADVDVGIYDVPSGTYLSHLRTTLDFGGRRLALTENGKHCIVGAYYQHGLASYDVSTGTEAWRRKDLKRVQIVRVLPGGRQVFCAMEGKASQLLDVASGETLEVLKGVREVYASSFADLRMIERRRIVLEVAGTSAAAAPCQSLSAAFGPHQFCVSEAGGPVRGLELPTLRETWRYEPGPGSHVLYVTWSADRGSFVGAEWPYQRGGPLTILAFDAPAYGSVIRVLDTPRTATFLDHGRWLATSMGDLVDTRTGDVHRRFAFPERPDTGEHDFPSPEQLARHGSPDGRALAEMLLRTNPGQS